MKQYTIGIIEAMQEFFYDVINDFNCTLHPDDRFSEMVDENGKAAFSIETALYLDSIMDKCFVFGKVNNLDIYVEAGTIQIREYKSLGLLPENFGTDVEGD